VISDVETQPESDEKKDVSRSDAGEKLVLLDALEASQVSSHRLPGCDSEVIAGEREIAEGQGPGHDVNIVQRYGERDEDAEHAEILGERVLPQELEHAGGVAVAVPSSHAADGALGPHEGNPHDEERHEIGDHEGAAAVFRGLDGEAEKIAQADGVSGQGQDQPDLRGPFLALDFFRHKNVGSLSDERFLCQPLAPFVQANSSW